MDEDEISPKEAGFMEGYEDAELAECGTCGKQVDMEKAVEKEINGKTFWFCSKKCADNFEKRKAYD
ncbi:MAG TPA: YHS domain-containing protein [archaeon]|nr:YHS domain-containing protein [archaeon]